MYNQLFIWWDITRERTRKCTSLLQLWSIQYTVYRFGLGNCNAVLCNCMSSPLQQAVPIDLLTNTSPRSSHRGFKKIIMDTRATGRRCCCWGVCTIVHIAVVGTQSVVPFVSRFFFQKTDSTLLVFTF